MTDIEYIEIVGRLAANQCFSKEAGLSDIPSWAWKTARTIYDKHRDMYIGIRNRYGPVTAAGIAAAYVAGLPLPGPGTGFVTALPAVGAAELAYRAGLIGEKPRVDPLKLPRKLNEAQLVRFDY